LVVLSDTLTFILVGLVLTGLALGNILIFALFFAILVMVNEPAVFSGFMVLMVVSLATCIIMSYIAVSYLVKRDNDGKG